MKTVQLKMLVNYEVRNFILRLTDAYNSCEIARFHYNLIFEETKMIKRMAIEPTRIKHFRIKIINLQLNRYEHKSFTLIKILLNTIIKKKLIMITFD